MAGTTQYFGVTYPTSTDYVKDGAIAIEAVADGFDAAVAIPTYNTQTGTTYTFVLLDAAKVVTSNNASAVTFTIPPQADVVWTTGATLTVANYGAGSVTIAGGSGVTVTNSTSTVGQFGSASIIRTGSNAWTVIPFAGGAVPLSDSAITGTTGSPTTGTYTDSGINYKFYRFTGSGSITTNKAGLVDVLVVAGGGGGGYNNYGAGAGGMIYQTNFHVASGTQTVTIGGGGTNNPTRGGQSSIGNLTAVGGGFVRFNVSDSSSFGGSSGSGNAGSTVGQNIAGQGNIGGVGGSAAGGGGAGGIGGNTGAAGAGLANSITGTSVTYATGGANNTGSGAANTGNGAGGSGTTNLGGSGVVVVRVRA